MKYSTFRIEPHPLDKFPEMVVVKKGKIHKRFVDINKAKAWIDTFNSETAIAKEERKAKKQLIKTVIMD